MGVEKAKKGRSPKNLQDRKKAKAHNFYGPKKAKAQYLYGPQKGCGPKPMWTL